MQFWRFLNHRLGISISQSYLITDSLVVLLAGFAFGWIRVLYGLVMIYVSGSAAETSSEGSDVFRTAWIVTNKSDEVSHAILDVLERGVTILSGKGAYTGAERPVLYCVVTRSEVNQPGKLIYLRGSASCLVGLCVASPFAELQRQAACLDVGAGKSADHGRGHNLGIVFQSNISDNTWTRSRKRHSRCPGLTGGVEDIFAARDHLQPVRLVQAIVHGFAQQRKVAAAQGFDHKSGAADIKNSVAQGNFPRQRGAGSLGGQVDGWNGNRYLQRRHWQPAGKCAFVGGDCQG